MIDPIIAGIIAKPPMTGPQLPKIRPPNQEPIKPAIILPIIPPGTSRPVSKPASQPIIPPTISIHRILIHHSLLLK